MRQNRLRKSIFVISCAFLIFSSCQQPTHQPAPKQITIIQEPEKTSDAPVETQTKPNALPPAIVFEVTDVNFGQVGPATVSSTELKFENTGEGVLEIFGISQCCGVVAETDKNEYEPGETGTLKIEYYATASIGEISREPVVSTNDPENPEIMLSVIAEIVQIVVWEPENIKLYLNKENAACPKLTIKSLDEKPFAIRQIKSTGDCITADYNATVEQKEFVIDLQVDIEKLPENSSGTIKLTMNHPQGNIAEIPFQVEQRFDLNPKPLFLFNLNENEPRKEKIDIINNYDEDFEIESTSSKENSITMLDYNKIENGYEMNIEITPPTADGNVRFTDIFYINIKGGEQLALTCTGYYESK